MNGCLGGTCTRLSAYTPWLLRRYLSTTGTRHVFMHEPPASRQCSLRQHYVVQIVGFHAQRDPFKSQVTIYIPYWLSYGSNAAG